MKRTQQKIPRPDNKTVTNQNHTEPNRYLNLGSVWQFSTVTLKLPGMAFKAILGDLEITLNEIQNYVQVRPWDDLVKSSDHAHASPQMTSSPNFSCKTCKGQACKFGDDLCRKE